MSRTDIEIEITRSFVFKFLLGLGLFLLTIFLLNNRSKQRLTKKYVETYAYYDEHPGLDSIKLFLDTINTIDSNSYKKLSEWIPNNTKSHYQGAMLWVKREGQYSRISYNMTQYGYKFDKKFNRLPNNLEEIISSPDLYQKKLDDFLKNGYGHLIIMIDSSENKKAFFQSSWISLE